MVLVFKILSTFCISLLILICIKVILGYYGDVKLREVMAEFTKTIEEISNLDFSNLSKSDCVLVSRVLYYDRALENHNYYGTIFEYIAYQEVLSNIKLTLIDILPSGRIAYRDEIITDILK